MIKRISEKFTPKQYLLAFFFLVGMLFGVYLIVAWSSYSPLDNSWASSSYIPTTINKAGRFGAWFIDLFFVLFGHVGHIIPFLIFGISFYFWRRKGKVPFSFFRLSLWLLGFSIFLCGVCVLFTLLFSNTPYYLSGGVLGGSLVTAFFPMLDFVGLMLSGTLLALLGFVLCSGTSLIRSCIYFYDWLTMKNPTQTQEEETISATPVQQELALQEEPSIQSINESERVFVSEVPSATMDEEKSLINIENLIQIQGLESASQAKESTIPAVPLDDVNQVELGGYAVEPELALPSVSVAFVEDTALSSSEAEHEDSKPFTTLIPHTAGEPLVATEFAMPKVSLSPLDTSLSDNSEIAREDESDLARQFAAQEQQRREEMALRAKALNAEDALQTILAAPEIRQNSTADVSDSTTPHYKPYGESLIHPALQQKVTTQVKPTTPMPSLDLLEHRPSQAHRITQEEIIETSQRIEHQLRNFGVKATVKDVLVGPVVTRYELELQPGVKASKVSSIDTDLARALMFRSIRVAEVIPGKPYIGIETPNVNRQMVTLREVLDSDVFRQSNSLLSMALGKDISGKPVVVDLAKMPHLLVAGSTGSGKSVGVNTMILSLLFRVKPEEVKFIMIDPKVVELSIYDGIPHLLTEVVTDMKKAANALRWCVDEMERRYQLLSALRVRNIEGYNEKIEEYEAMNMPIPNPIWRPGDTMDTLPPALEKLSYIVVIVDEFADLMMVAGKQVEELIARLAQKARAIGIHLILATQRPSVDVITGLIKANIPSRIAFTVASKIDSRTILDQVGAEALLGRGDMLYSGAGSSDLVRVHGAFMSDDEVARVVDDWKARGKPNYIEGILDSGEDEATESNGANSDAGELDDLFDEVVEFVTSTGTTSTSYIQRKFRVGFNRAARIMDQLEEQGIVSAMQNGKREVLARRSSDF
ncbi:TPA: DNA translocase FtsK [Pasteurella multocida]|uniref:DNA translocase FtsK n=1 Tax=Pasteurella multocida TaxID=747 RepID=UPI00201FB846|nr:DNA translocase FtsK [Pasteurella multocida]MCL7797072.1 DNA translocase FtsK 4TM domain-containing protein [Pasteurella multocida]MCL7801286.1 DNA translocase FtsK 4TM domain-containing protein [Pasteurella multocida]MDG2540273.1 DNA translocase FtsK 4TM domain-containing protein [Pasteurella multocida]URH97197.1 DNA translocase FtsK 4TM domain-containing protein [Pasteurella multocida]URJ97975.1 DNA translocase FtsK 4TM domain-containing protein [Pasteurella multocida]